MSDHAFGSELASKFEIWWKSILIFFFVLGYVHGPSCQIWQEIIGR